jgi:hypothetical protein
MTSFAGENNVQSEVTGHGHHGKNIVVFIATEQYKLLKYRSSLCYLSLSFHPFVSWTRAWVIGNRGGV